MGHLNHRVVAQDNASPRVLIKTANVRMQPMTPVAEVGSSNCDKQVTIGDQLAQNRDCQLPSTNRGFPS
jgi:hypothetical protein